MAYHNMYERLYSKIIVGEAYYPSVRNIVEDTKFNSFIFCARCVRTKLLSFDARKETALAISSGLPNLHSGMVFMKVVFNFSASCTLCKACLNPGVSI